MRMKKSSLMANDMYIDPTHPNCVVGKKAWDAYLFATIVLIFILIFNHTFFYIHDANRKILYALDIVCVIFYLYRILVLKSYKISLDDDGIWLSYGILPWTMAGNGIRWKDADMAFYYPNFLSWVCNSYNVSVNHKYTNLVDFVASDIWRGRRVVELINKEIRARS